MRACGAAQARGALGLLLSIKAEHIAVPGFGTYAVPSYWRYYSWLYLLADSRPTLWVESVQSSRFFHIVVVFKNRFKNMRLVGPADNFETFLVFRSIRENGGYPM
jgi:hypothetical protein